MAVWRFEGGIQGLYASRSFTNTCGGPCSGAAPSAAVELEPGSYKCKVGLPADIPQLQNAAVRPDAA